MTNSFADTVHRKCCIVGKYEDVALDISLHASPSNCASEKLSTTDIPESVATACQGSPNNDLNMKE